MVHYTKVVEGLQRFIDADLVQKMNGSLKAWAVGAIATLYANKADSVFNELRENQLIKVLHIIDGEMIDIDTIYHAMHEQAEKRSATVNLPLIGVITYNVADVETLYRMITQ